MDTVTYIWHDCFVVEIPSATLVFDYWRDVDGSAPEAPGFLGSVRKDKPLYVFVSHFHKDHYNPDIFAWPALGFDVRYFVSVDVWKRMRHIVSRTSVYAGPKVEADRVVVLRPGASYSDSTVSVKAFPSTDVGNSWFVEIDGRRIFHAGDLNAWIWRDESSASEVQAGLDAFRNCLAPISGVLKADGSDSGMPIDYCFFPVDSRIGSGYYVGARLFLQMFDVRIFFAMHFALGDEAEREVRRADAMRTELYANASRGKCHQLSSPGSYLTFSSFS